MPRIITLLGARDGVGTTTLAANLALALQKGAAANVLLLNLSYPGDVSSSLGDDCRSVKDVHEMLGRTAQVLAATSFHTRFKGVAAIERDEDDYEPKIFSNIMKAVESSYSYIIIDAGSAINQLALWGLKNSQRCIVTVNSDLQVLSSAKKMIEKFKRALLPEVFLVLAATRWEETSFLPRSVVRQRLRLECGFFMPADEAVSTALKRGVPIFVENPHHSYSIEVALLAKNIIGDKATADKRHVNWVELGDEPPHTIKKADSSFNDGSAALKKDLLQKLLDSTELKNARGNGLYEKARLVIIKLLEETAGQARLVDIDKQAFIEEVLDEALGLGPLEDLLKDDEITEIMANAHDRIYVERGGRIFATDRRFLDNGQMMKAVERIVAPIGRRIDESSPMVDARLADGSRVNVIIPPLSLEGPVITIRKFAKRAFSESDLVARGSLSKEAAAFLRACVKDKRNILISGGTGTGKTTLLNVLSSYIGEDERIITIEDSAELKLCQRHVVRLEARPPNIEGRGEITIRDLVRNAMRMRPDRIIVGECRGGEALDMLQALNTGHSGSLTTIHSNSPRDSLTRLETLVLFAGVEIPLRAIREQIASAIGIIIQLSRLPDGKRGITGIFEVIGIEGDNIAVRERAC